MARTTRTSTAREVEPQPQSLVAAATRLPGTPTGTSMSGRSGQAWQVEAWRFYNIIGEYRYAVQWVSSMISRARLYVHERGEDGRAKPSEDTSAQRWLDDLFGGPEGHPQMLADIATHLTVAGECYLVAYEQDGEEQWFIVAAHQMSKSGGKWRVERKELPGKPLVIRIWDPHPTAHAEANSPTRAVLPILSEIERLTMHVAAQIDSRLISAGILFLSSDLNFPAPPVTEGQEVDNRSTSQQFSDLLQRAARTAIRNRDSAEAMVPIVVTVPSEEVGKAHHLTFWSGLDEQAIELRKEALRHLALGMDIPPEVLLGVADANHWSAWQVDESAIKAHAEPTLLRVTSALATGYLRPLVTKEDGKTVEQARRFGISADTSEMRLRPNRSKEALELYDRGELDGQTLRKETGFHDEEALDDAERHTWVLLQIVTGKLSVSPEQAAWAMEQLGLVGMPATNQTGNGATPSLIGHPSRDIPEMDAALLAAADGLVLRALERAGNRMRTRKIAAKVDGVHAVDAYLTASAEGGLPMDFLLEDAWGHTDRVAGHLCGDTLSLSHALDTYCRHLLTSRKPHDRAMLANYITLLVPEGASR